VPLLTAGVRALRRDVGWVVVVSQRGQRPLEQRSAVHEPRAQIIVGGFVILAHPNWGVATSRRFFDTGHMTSSVSVDVLRRRRNDLLRSIEQAESVAGVFTAASSRLRRVVPFDAAAWVSTDPGTGLPNGPTLLDHVDGVSAADCSEHWRREFIGDDVNLFRDLTTATIPAAGLRHAIGEPRYSRRYRTFLQPHGFDDEMRAVIRAGDTQWGTISLLRHPGRPPFSEWEARLVGSLSEPLGDALRTRAQKSEQRRVRADQPGLMIFDATGRLVSVNDEARAWLAEMPADQTTPTDLGIDVPVWLTITVFQAGALPADRGAARSRLLTRDGAWLVCHASPLRTADGASGEVAVVIEPARPAEIAPIVLDAYDLTGREQQITALIARGVGTAEIADELYLSAHTVRGYVKAIFRKLSVASRGELVAKLFAEHYEPAHAAAITRVDTRIA